MQLVGIQIYNKFSSSRSCQDSLLGLLEPENGDTKILRNVTVHQSTLFITRKDFEVDMKLLKFVVTLESPLRVRVMSLCTPLSVPSHSLPTQLMDFGAQFLSSPFVQNVIYVLP